MKESPGIPSYRAFLMMASIVALSFGTGSCVLDDESELVIRAVESLLSVEHPSLPDSMLPVNNSLMDSAGLAGLEIQVAGRTLTAADFRSRPSHQWGVPATGSLRIELRLAQGGQVVAQGDTIWKLQARTSWDLHFNRGLVPAYYHANEPFTLNDLGHPTCRVLGDPWFCSGILRIPIADWAANFRDEALWLHWHGGRIDLW